MRERTGTSGDNWWFLDVIESLLKLFCCIRFIVANLQDNCWLLVRAVSSVHPGGSVVCVQWMTSRQREMDGGWSLWPTLIKRRESYFYSLPRVNNIKSTEDGPQTIHTLSSSFCRSLVWVNKMWWMLQWNSPHSFPRLNMSFAVLNCGTQCS